MHIEDPIELPEVGDVLGNFVVEAELGRGGMAVVYRVRHSRLGSAHALKVLTIGRRTVVTRLIQEGQVQATLRHPNIVAVTDVIDVGELPGLVLEYVDGPSLDDWLEVNGPPALPIAESWFRQIVSAIAHAHDHGFVHRDVKPSNVLLQPLPQGLVPKVADFGIAKLLDEGDDGPTQTRTGVAMGTPAYMAPEQIRDAKSVDARADVFGLGCILYELVCGRQAFVGVDILELFNAVASGTFEDPLTLKPDLEPRIRRCIRGCLRVDRNIRLQSCDQIIEILDGVDPDGFRATPAPARRNTWLPPDALVGPDTPGPVVKTKTQPSGPSAGLATVVLDGEPDEVPEAVPAPATRPRRSPWAWLIAAVGGIGAGGTLLVLGAVGILAWWLLRAPVAIPDPEPAPVSVAPEPEPEPEPETPPEPEPTEVVVAPAPPVHAPVPPAPVFPQLSGAWSGSSGRGPMTLVIETQRGGRLEGKVDLQGLPLRVAGTVSTDGRVSLQQIDGPAVFEARLDRTRMSGTWRREAASQEYQWLVVR